MIKSYQRII